MNTIELFSGAGGLALGCARAGFDHEFLIDWDKHSCHTLRLNKEHELGYIKDWDIREGDVRQVDYSTYEGAVDLVSGGPPCQPFSLGGKHTGYLDPRDMFPVFVDVIRQVQPKAVLIENVRGLLRPKFENYMEYLYLQLTYPELTRRKDESMPSHLSRLERHHTKGTHKGLSYNVVYHVLDAADFGVPQKRERVFIVGFRSDLGIEWSFKDNVPRTHSRERLLWDQWISGEYWEKHRVPKCQRPTLSKRLGSRVRRIADSDNPPTNLKPWQTVRDAIGDLPEPVEHMDSFIPNHMLKPGAKAYPGHTGSHLDEPAKTLKAGDHGVPGGENMLAFQDGTVRYFSVRESARLQTFPDDYVLESPWTESLRQLGNAVPVDLGYAVAKGIVEALREHS